MIAFNKNATSNILAMARVIMREPEATNINLDSIIMIETIHS